MQQIKVIKFYLRELFISHLINKSNEETMCRRLYDSDRIERKGKETETEKKKKIAE